MDESVMITKTHLNAHLLCSPCLEYPLPPLHRACRDGDTRSLTYLVTQGDRLEVFHNINEQDRYLSWTPAHWASYFGRLDCLKKLVSCGLNIDIGDGKFNQTPAQLAAFAGHSDVLLWLLKCGASTDRVDKLGENVVHKAARSGSIECLSLLKAYGAPMITPNSNKQTPCDVAASLGLEQCCMLLSSFGIPSASKQSLKRCLDEEMQCDDIKRLKNGKVQYNGYVEMISTEQNGLSLQNNSSNVSCFYSRDSQVCHNGFLNGDCDSQSKQIHSLHHSQNGVISSDTDMIDTEPMGKLESECNNNNIHTLVADDVDEAIKKDYSRHPHFTYRCRAMSFYGHLA